MKPEPQILGSKFKLQAVADALEYRIEDVFSALRGPRPERRLLIAGAKKTGHPRDFFELVVIACIVAARSAVKPGHRAQLLAMAHEKLFRSKVRLAIRKRPVDCKLSILPDSPPRFSKGGWDSLTVDVAAVALHLHEQLERLAKDPEWLARNLIGWVGPAEVSED